MIEASPPESSPASAIESLQARFVAEALPEADAEALPEADAEALPEAEELSEPVAETADLAAELEAAEKTGEEEVTAVLTAVLDRLGAAHHRPFSRA
jgi:hypothetical protein